MDNENKSSEDSKQKKLTPHELAKKHLSDPNHKMTEDEMKNLDVDPEADPELKKKEEEKLDELKKETDKHPPLNPYDIIDE